MNFATKLPDRHDFGGNFLPRCTSPASSAPTPPVLEAMKAELDRSVTTLSKGEPSNYFLSYTVSDREMVTVFGLEWRAAYER